MAENICNSLTLLQHDPKDLFLNQQGHPTEGLIQLLLLDNLYCKEDTLADIVQKTQCAWLALTNKDTQIRSDLADTSEKQVQREKVIEIVRQMGLFEARLPASQHYDYAICLGALLDGVRFRLNELVLAWQQGIRFNSLVFLAGERDLRKNAGEPEEITLLCNPALSPLPFKKDWKCPENVPYATEYDMVKLVWEQTELPQDMVEALAGKVFFVNAPRGDHARPNTKDTYQTWLTEYHPKPGTVLAASHPMLWCYQQLAGANALGPHFPLETIAPAVTAVELQKYRYVIVTLVHDTIAKCLYEIYHGNK